MNMLGVLRHLKKQAGFTLIEVVLVLAIGGLIFLLAFLAFSQASVNRRDTQRRQDARKVLADAENFAADHNGAYPCNEAPSGPSYCHVGYPSTTSYDTASWPQFYAYIGQDSLKNPKSNSDYYYVAYRSVNAPTLSQGFFDSAAALYAPGNLMVMAKGGQCSGAAMGIPASAGNTFAVWIKLEKGQFCVDTNAS